MGSNENENEDEKPIHNVIIAKPFALGKFPITFAEFDYFAEQTGKTKPSDEGWGRERRPVINVSWANAKAYADWLVDITGKAYRLPSEAELEYVARSGSDSDFYWGDAGKAEQYAWFRESSGGKTQAVGQLKANAFGLYDMAGNVWEWLEDHWHDSYVGAPNDGSVWTSDKLSGRVLRGGSWIYNLNNLRSADRFWFNPGLRYYFTGFRLAQDLP